MNLLHVAAFAALAMLAACGGGGDPGTSPFNTYTGGNSGGSAGGSPGSGSSGSGSSSGGSSSAAVATQGFYTGRTSNDFDFGGVILETGEFWGIYSRSGVVYGAAHGTSTATATGFTGQGFDYYLPDGSRTAATFSGTYVPKTSIAGTISSTRATFDGTYDSAYEQPARLADLTGTWRGNVVSPGGVQAAAVTINADGTFSGTVTTCSYSGRVAPRESGKAVFNVTITFGATGCVFNGRTLSGISVLNGGALVTAALLQDGSSGFLSAGSR